MLLFRFCSKEQFLRKGDANASSHLALLSYVAKCDVEEKAFEIRGLRAWTVRIDISDTSKKEQGDIDRIHRLLSNYHYWSSEPRVKRALGRRIPSEFQTLRWHPAIFEAFRTCADAR